MDYDNANWEFDNFRLPMAFWEALWEVRCYLIRNHEFTGLIYGRKRDQSLRQAFDLIEDYLKRTVEDLDLVESC